MHVYSIYYDYIETYMRIHYQQQRMSSNLYALKIEVYQVAATYVWFLEKRNSILPLTPFQKSI